MGALFHLNLGLIDPAALRAAAARGGFSVIGLATDGTPFDEVFWPARSALVVGHERHGLGAWAEVCDQKVGIRMSGASESLNAAIAGSIVLYEAAKGRR
jgi:tRNA G18 (ribose-2'-O)-methylase SpoU